MYEVTVVIPMDYTIEVEAEDAKAAIEAFWERINDMSKEEMYEFIRNPYYARDFTDFDRDNIDWVEARPYVSLKESYHILFSNGEIKEFRTEEEMTKFAESTDYSGGFQTVTSWQAYDEDGNPTDGGDDDDDDDQWGY